MAHSKEMWSGGCHCRAVLFDVRLSEVLTDVRRRNCSYCRMRGAVIASADINGLVFRQGEDRLTSYRFGTSVAQHFFCSCCGISTHLRRRSDPSRFGVNVACLDEVGPFDFPNVPVSDGINHPGDVGGLARFAGTLRYVPTG